MRERRINKELAQPYKELDVIVVRAHRLTWIGRGLIPFATYSSCLLTKYSEKTFGDMGK